MAARADDSADTVLVDREGGIVTVTLNRPEKLNALTKAMWARLGGTMRALDRDQTVRCIVLRGAGEKAFGPGADISRFETERRTVRQAAAYGRVMHATLDAVLRCRHPTVAMIYGLCVGGSLEVAACCDLRIAGRSARFGVPIQRIGQIMAYPELARLIDLVGRPAALEILLEGRVFGAEEAHAKGLVTRVVADADVATETYATAERIAAGAPLSHRWHKKFALRLQNSRPLSRREKAEGFANCRTEDYLEGYRSFLEKRPPVFKGR